VRWKGEKGEKGKTFSTTGKGGGKTARTITARATEKPDIPQPTPNSLAVVHEQEKFDSTLEAVLEEKARELCVEKGFSTPEQVRFVSPKLMYIDFPYFEVCSQFLKASEGFMVVGDMRLKVQKPGEQTDVTKKPDEDDEEGSAIPSHTLMVRHIGDLSEADLLAAVQAIYPSIESVKVVFDRNTGNSRGFGFVTFYSVSEAESAFAKMQAGGFVLCNRKVAVSFTKPQNEEQAIAASLKLQREQDELQAQAEQALSGINGDMWASYLKFCNQGS